MLRINSLQNFIAYNKILEDYKKLEFYYREYQEKKEFAESKILSIIIKEIDGLLNNIIDNKSILNIDSSEDVAIQNDVNNHLSSIKNSQILMKSSRNVAQINK